MAKKMTPRKPLEVLHACPDCEIGKVNPWCTTCHGRGLLTDLQLFKWEREINARNDSSE